MSATTEARTICRHLRFLNFDFELASFPSTPEDVNEFFKCIRKQAFVRLLQFLLNHLDSTRFQSEFRDLEFPRHEVKIKNICHRWLKDLTGFNPTDNFLRIWGYPQGTNVVRFLASLTSFVLLTKNRLPTNPEVIPTEDAIRQLLHVYDDDKLVFDAYSSQLQSLKCELQAMKIQMESELLETLGKVNERFQDSSTPIHTGLTEVIASAYLPDGLVDYEKHLVDQVNTIVKELNDSLEEAEPTLQQIAETIDCLRDPEIPLLDGKALNVKHLPTALRQQLTGNVNFEEVKPLRDDDGRLNIHSFVKASSLLFDKMTTTFKQSCRWLLPVEVDAPSSSDSCSSSFGSNRLLKSFQRLSLQLENSDESVHREVLTGCRQRLEVLTKEVDDHNRRSREESMSDCVSSLPRTPLRVLQVGRDTAISRISACETTTFSSNGNATLKWTTTPRSADRNQRLTPICSTKLSAYSTLTNKTPVKAYSSASHESDERVDAINSKTFTTPATISEVCRNRLAASNLSSGASAEVDWMLTALDDDVVSNVTNAFDLTSLKDRQSECLEHCSAIIDADDDADPDYRQQPVYSEEAVACRRVLSSDVNLDFLPEDFQVMDKENRLQDSTAPDWGKAEPTYRPDEALRESLDEVSLLYECKDAHDERCDSKSVETLNMFLDVGRPADDCPPGMTFMTDSLEQSDLLDDSFINELLPSSPQ